MRKVFYQRFEFESDDEPLLHRFGPSLWFGAYSHSEDEMKVEELLVAYFSGQTSDAFLDQRFSGADEGSILKVIDWFVSLINDVSINHLGQLLCSAVYVFETTNENAPQLSSFEASTIGVIDLLSCAGDEGLGFTEIGYHLNRNGKRANEVANRKYGENCAKFAALLGLVSISSLKNGVKERGLRYVVRITRLGKVVLNLDDQKRNRVIAKLTLRIAMFRNLIFCNQADNEIAFRNAVAGMSVSTRERRKSAMNILVREFVSCGGELPDANKVKELICTMKMH